MKKNPHAKAITALGGPKKVAERLGYEIPGGTRRVSNWKRRGIPRVVQLETRWLRSELNRQEGEKYK